MRKYLSYCSLFSCVRACVTSAYKPWTVYNGRQRFRSKGGLNFFYFPFYFWYLISVVAMIFTYFAGLVVGAHCVHTRGFHWTTRGPPIDLIGGQLRAYGDHRHIPCSYLCLLNFLIARTLMESACRSCGLPDASRDRQRLCGDIRSRDGLHFWVSLKYFSASVIAGRNITILFRIVFMILTTLHYFCQFHLYESAYRSCGLLDAPRDRHRLCGGHPMTNL